MLTKPEYDILQDIMELPNHGFPEGECPSYLNWPKVAEIIELGYMKRCTLALPNDDPLYPEGRSWFRISSEGYHLIDEYKERLREQKRGTFSSALGHVISLISKG